MSDPSDACHPIMDVYIAIELAYNFCTANTLLICLFSSFFIVLNQMSNLRYFVLSPLISPKLSIIFRSF